MLEEKLFGRVTVAAREAGPYLAAAAMVLLPAYGCGGPSEECCKAAQCGEEGNPPECDGYGDDGYCREKTCCESLDEESK